MDRQTGPVRRAVPRNGEGRNRRRPRDSQTSSGVVSFNFRELAERLSSYRHGLILNSEALTPTADGYFGVLHLETLGESPPSGDFPQKPDRLSIPEKFPEAKTIEWPPARDPPPGGP